MAISLLFGAITSVTLTMLTLPLRCIAARSAFCEKPTDADQAPHPQEPEQDQADTAPDEAAAGQLPRPGTA